MNDVQRPTNRSEKPKGNVLSTFHIVANGCWLNWAHTSANRPPKITFLNNARLMVELFQMRDDIAFGCLGNQGVSLFVNTGCNVDDCVWVR